MNGESRSMSIKVRLLLIMVVGLVGMLVISGFALMSEKSTLLEDRKVKTRHLVEVAHGILVHYHAMQQKGSLSEAQAKEAAIGAIKSLRYEQKEYFWINDMLPRVIMHPIKPELDGKDVSDFKDPDGNLLFVEFANVVKKEDAGFVAYLWPKPGASKPVPKISYVKGFEPWGWVIGSGIYIDDVQSIFWQRATWLVSIVLGVTVVVGFMLLVQIRSITHPLAELKDAMKAIQTTQNLSRRVTVKENNEIGEIGHSFNAMVKSFQEIIQQVVSGVHEVMDGAAHLSESSQHVAASSSQQSEAAISMATAVEEMTASIDHVASSSKETYAIAQQAGTLSAEGGAIVQNAAAEMSKIADSVNHSTELIQKLGEQSNQISAIVGVIKDIADQTNLLALNAAIEAARAGEQGRGFAVVADEVRKLAERTTKSTHEISSMIETIQEGIVGAVTSMDQGTERVREGVVMARQAGESMQRIREGAEHVIRSVSEITDALHEQNAASSQVSESVEQIAQMADKNNVEVGEIARTSERLSQLANSLQSSVQQFKV